MHWTSPNLQTFVRRGHPRESGKTAHRTGDISPRRARPPERSVEGTLTTRGSKAPQPGVETSLHSSKEDRKRRWFFATREMQIPCGHAALHARELGHEPWWPGHSWSLTHAAGGETVRPRGRRSGVHAHLPCDPVAGGGGAPRGFSSE